LQLSGLVRLESKQGLLGYCIPCVCTHNARDKVTLRTHPPQPFPQILSQSLWLFSVWLVFTSNLNSQTTWLKVKLKLVNLSTSPKSDLAASTIMQVLKFSKAAGLERVGEIAILPK